MILIDPWIIMIIDTIGGLRMMIVVSHPHLGSRYISDNKKQKTFHNASNKDLPQDVTLKG